MAHELYRDIEVICRFSGIPNPDGPRVMPLRVRRVSRASSAHAVEEITFHWISRHGSYPWVHVEVLLDDRRGQDGEAVELVFDTERLRWLERIRSTVFERHSRRAKR